VHSTKDPYLELLRAFADWADEQVDVVRDDAAVRDLDGVAEGARVLAVTAERLEMGPLAERARALQLRATSQRAFELDGACSMLQDELTHLRVLLDHLGSAAA